jgi:DNA (cytosine-5)-methyltransferase 1
MQAIKDLHFTNEDVKLNNKRTKQEMIEFLYQKGISNNWNEPMTKEQISRLSEKQLKQIIKNIAITHNLVNIQQVKGEDLEIVDNDKYTYLLTYSFPCQDLSVGGLGKGMSDTSTRSGMLWEVERILQECKDIGALPDVLLMENVPQVHSVDNLQDFNKWQLKLEQLGYTNYFQDLIGTDYGIPQTRNRCFMVSILGEYAYTFPKPIPLELRLKDILEDDVDEKYYLSDAMIKYLTDSVSSGGIDRSESFNRIQEKIQQEGIAATITTNAGSRATDNYIIETTPKVVAGIGEKKSNGGRQFYQQDRVYDDNVSIAIATSFAPYYKTGDRVRKLSTREVGRLMGVKDEDIDKILKNQSDSSAFHLFGDSIITNVLMAIFKEML